MKEDHADSAGRNQNQFTGNVRNLSSARTALTMGPVVEDVGHAGSAFRIQFSTSSGDGHSFSIVSISLSKGESP